MAVVYNNLRTALVTLDEPPSNIIIVDAVTFGQRLNGPTINRYTLQFTGGGGGGPTMAIEVQGPTGAYSPYTNAGGDAATGIVEDEAYIVDTGSWTAFRVTFTGSDGSAVLSVLGWTASDTVPALTAQVDALETDVTTLQAEVATLTPQMANFTVSVVANTTATFVALPFESGDVSSARYTAAVAGASAAGTITLALKRLDNDAVIVAATNIDGQTSVALTVGTGDFENGVYAEVVSNNVDATAPVGGAVHLEYTR